MTKEAGVWERGTRTPSLEVAYALADCFDVSLDYLVGRSDDSVKRKTPQ
ncbi:helix-turn-helix domain-containing protein [Paenibacillus sp. TH7-28]